MNTLVNFQQDQKSVHPFFDLFKLQLVGKKFRLTGKLFTFSKTVVTGSLGISQGMMLFKVVRILYLISANTETAGAGRVVPFLKSHVKILFFSLLF